MEAELIRTEEFTIVVESQKGVREALAAVWKAAARAQWIILGDYDLAGLFAAPSESISEKAEIKSIDICHPELARPFVAADKLTALCMPCNVLIYQDQGRTRLAAMRPGVMMPQLFAQATHQLGDLPARIDGELRAILEAAR
jgi:uncharacterized protein (DUF302 family)